MFMYTILYSKLKMIKFVLLPWNYKRLQFSHVTRDTNYEKLSTKTSNTHNNVINLITQRHIII